MAVEIFMPKMSDHMEVGEIIRWLVKEGDRVDKGQIILEVMTDKAVAELEAPASGVLKGIRAGAEDGAEVPVGETFAFIAEPDEEVPVLPPLGSAEAKGVEEETPPPAPTPSAEPTPVPGAGEGRAGPGPVRATPVARRIAKELGVDLSLVRGTGPGGRITEEDVRAFAEALSATPSAQPAEEGAEWLDLTSIQRLTGRRMLESLQTAPQFALTINVDMTNALWLREALMERVLAETGERLSVTAILVKVVAAALKSYPRANASFEGGQIKLHPRVNVGVAVGTDDGLVVPVIKEADQKSLVQITQELKSFQDKARQMRFSAEELSGGTFTISNLGMYGVDRFNAIINPPQSAILAVGQIIKTPVGMPDDTIALRPMMSLTLSVDHRSIDGVQGARFLAEIKERLEKPYFLL